MPHPWVLDSYYQLMPDAYGNNSSFPWKVNWCTGEPTTQPSSHGLQHMKLSRLKKSTKEEEKYELTDASYVKQMLLM